VLRAVTNATQRGDAAISWWASTTATPPLISERVPFGTSTVGYGG
jgi:hypothetical protein